MIHQNRSPFHPGPSQTPPHAEGGPLLLVPGPWRDTALGNGDDQGRTSAITNNFRQERREA